MLACLCTAVLLYPHGAAVLRTNLRGAELVLTTTPRLAGAVHSIRWKNVEFIDSLDHGRQLQSASSFDGARPGPFWAECYNPTEAGSRRDHTGPLSSSRLLYRHATATELTTVVRPAFWLAPGERSDGKPAINNTILSDHRFHKTITLHDNNDPRRIRYRIALTIPPTEKHTLAQFEAVTGYMPAKFNVFEAFDSATETLSRISVGPGEQPKPVVLSTSNGMFAMGVIEREPPSDASSIGPGYGRFQFEPEKVVKWNAVYRLKNPAGVPAGTYTYDLVVAIGTREDVRAVFCEVSRVAAARPRPR
jgi:hypothetical protein